MEKFVFENIIYKTVVGSTAYGLDTKDSDVDIKGICIKPKEYYFGLKVFEQQEFGKDEVIYSIQKFFKLARDCNPNLIEMLYVDPKHILVNTKYGELLRENRDLFLSTKAKFTFSGYAFAQLKRIKNHRKWIMFKAERPKEEDFFVDKIRIMGNGEKIPYKKFREHEFDVTLKKYNQYLTWKKNRDPSRAALEEKYGYDCYDKDTEFLTNNGWKRFNEVDSKDLLGTININSGELIFQRPTQKISKKSKYIYEIKNQYSHFRVTENHKLLVSPMHRNSNNDFSTKYDESKANWQLKSLKELKSLNQSYYHIKHTTNNFKKDYDISDDYLKLMGLFVSEGSFLKYNTLLGKKLKGVSISQLYDNDFHKFITSLNFKINSYKHWRNNRYEMTYNIYDKVLANRLLEECGEYCKYKKLPKWIDKLSQRQCDILLDSLILGDGTSKPYSEIYYTTSAQLSNDVQRLAIFGGHISKLWDYNNKWATQVYIKRQHIGIGNLIIKGKQSHVKKIEYNDRVVCFEVPNSTLITRYSGEISIQGNCKHAMHLMRLLRMGQEILRTGEVNVLRPDREELLQLRNGEWTYDKLIEEAEKAEKELEYLYENSPLQKKPRDKEIDKLLIEITEEFLNKKDK